MLDRLVKWYLARLPPAKQQLHDRTVLTVDARGLTIATRRRAVAQRSHVAWDDVQHIIAFRGDAYPLDVVAVAIGTTDGRRIDLDEQMIGWTDMLQGMHGALRPAMTMPQWLLLISAATGAGEFRVVFERPSAPAS